ncbi:MAG: hypothetical protein C0594_14470, partial [Marinilabiliales bacterium]
MYKILGFIVLFYFSTGLSAQVYKFKRYGAEEGLAQSFVYSISQDQNGYIWIGTGEGLSRFDGHEFKTFTVEDNLAANFINISYSDSYGNLWFGHNTGAVSVYRENRFHVFATDTTINSSINDITEDSKGNIWILSQNNGLVKVNKKFEYVAYSEPFKDLLLYSMEFVNDSVFLIGTNEGLYVFGSSDNGIDLLDIPDGPLTKIQCIAKSKKKNKYWVGTEDDGVYELNFDTEIVMDKLRFTEGVNDQDVEYLYQDSNGNLWICTFGQGVSKVVYSKTKQSFVDVVNYTDYNGLGISHVRSLFEDREGNIWIATYGKGVALLDEEFFTFYQYENDEVNDKIYSVYTDVRGKWFGMEAGLIRIDAKLKEKRDFYFGSNGLPSDKVTAIYRDADGKLWIGTEKSGIYWLDVENNTFVKYQYSDIQQENSVNVIDSYGDYLWLGTRSGLISLNLKTHAFRKFTTINGLPHNTINHINIDLSGKVWVATPSSYLTCVENDSVTKIPISTESGIINITCVTQNQNGEIWLGTYGNGVYKYDGESFVNYNTDEGLKSGYCYSIITDNSWNIWVGHRMGISRITNGKIKVYGKDEGINGDCLPNSICRDYSGII